jgi:hypothetical protein
MAKIKDVELPTDKKWKEAHWQAIYRNYVGAEFFKTYSDFFEVLYHTDFRYLWQINMQIIKYLLKCFNIDIEIMAASDLNINENLKHTDMIISVLDKLEATTYLSGPSGRKYMELEKMQQNGYDLKFSSFDNPVYKQRYPGFIPNLASIDLLFNSGPQSNQIIKSSGKMDD